MNRYSKYLSFLPPSIIDPDHYHPHAEPHKADPMYYSFMIIIIRSGPLSNSSSKNFDITRSTFCFYSQTENTSLYIKNESTSGNARSLIGKTMVSRKSSTETCFFFAISVENRMNKVFWSLVVSCDNTSISIFRIDVMEIEHASRTRKLVP